MGDLLAPLLWDVCHGAEVELHLRTLTGEVFASSANSSDEARLDVSASTFWQKEQRTFFDVWMFDPFAKSHLNQKLDTAKRRHYNHRIIEVEHSSVSPLVFSP